MAAWKQRLIAVAIFLALLAGSLGPIRSYDFFWHLATGRWIAEHAALPATDPFAVASSRGPWINGEWLFDVALHATHAAVGFTGLSWVRALVVALLFTSVFLLAARGGDTPLAFLLTALAFAGVQGHYEVRPATLAACFVAVAMALLASHRSWAWFALLTVVWINVHPSALLAPLFAGVRLRWRVALGSLVALLANPWGWRAILAPIELVAFVRGGSFVNAEWLPSRPTQFPLLFIALAGGCLLFAFATDRRTHAWRFAIIAILGLLAIEHVRNQGLFYAAFPLLAIAPMRRRIPLLSAFALAPLVLGLTRMDLRTGIDPNRYPVAAVARLRASKLRGNIYNADQFGGFLIWSFDPERRVLTDGRNELYRSYLAEYASARSDERRWRALLAKYHVDLAVEEYRPGAMEVVDKVTGVRRSAPASGVYFPRREWALIGYDRVAMVFARRDAYSAVELTPFEIRGIVPDAVAP